ncbi:MAG TPA: ATP-dependent zinc metalloprotease FtsH [Bacillota bacterium]|nr:ATP-dependent zinc metalloprotease FtsH [Bacillota bacterium]
MKKLLHSAPLYLLIILIAVAILNFFLTDQTQPLALEYNTFREYLSNGQISAVVQTDQTIKGSLTDGSTFVTVVPQADEEMVNKLILENTVKYEVELPPETPWWSGLLNTLFMFGLFIAFYYFFMQQNNGGGNKVMSFGRSRAKLQQNGAKQITFKDVAGYEEVKEELQEIVEFLRQPKRFADMGARIPKGVLLYGPPGTGKTWMAKAVAGEAGVPFFSISGSDFVEMFVGVGASRVRDLFETAKKSAPCIVFIDEIDAVGRQRGAGLGGGHDEREQTLNQLLVEMDGFEANDGIIILAATNRPDILDPALLRPGRFDRQVAVDRPDVSEREAVLRIHVLNKPLAEGINLKIIARSTPGFTPADLENLVNEAALLAARQNKTKIEMSDMEEAINRVIAGPAKKSRLMSDKEKKLSAYHEAGHAIVAHYLTDFDPVHMVTIVPRGRAGGFTSVVPEEDRYYVTKKDIYNSIAYALGGRVAESMVFGEVSTGASNDLERVTDMAHRLVTEYGMSDKLGPMTFGNKQHEVFLGRDLSQGRTYSEEVAALIDEEVRLVVDTCYKQATELLQVHRASLDLLADTLMEKETVKGEELNALFDRIVALADQNVELEQGKDESVE